MGNGCHSEKGQVSSNGTPSKCLHTQPPTPARTPPWPEDSSLLMTERARVSARGGKGCCEPRLFLLMIDTREKQGQLMTLSGSWLSGIKEGLGTARLQVTRGQRDKQATLKALPLSKSHIPSLRTPQEQPQWPSERKALEGRWKDQIIPCLNHAVPCKAPPGLSPAARSLAWCLGYGHSEPSVTSFQLFLVTGPLHVLPSVCLNNFPPAFSCL